MNDLIRVRTWGFDFDGKKSNMSKVQYIKSLEEISGTYWKIEKA